MSSVAPTRWPHSPSPYLFLWENGYSARKEVRTGVSSGVSSLVGYSRPGLNINVLMAVPAQVAK